MVSERNTGDGRMAVNREKIVKKQIEFENHIECNPTEVELDTARCLDQSVVISAGRKRNEELIKRNGKLMKAWMIGKE